LWHWLCDKYVTARHTLECMSTTKLSLPLGLAVREPEPGVWCVSYTDSDGAIYETRFVGPAPEARARDYYNAIRRRDVHNRIT
jgi:hypothetical protein